MLLALLLAVSAPCPDLSHPFRAEDRDTWGLWPDFPLSLDVRVSRAVRAPEGGWPAGERRVFLPFEVREEGDYPIALGQPGIFGIVMADGVEKASVLATVEPVSEDRPDCPGIERIVTYHLKPGWHFFIGYGLTEPRLSLMMLPPR